MRLRIAAALVALTLSAPALAQEEPLPGPEPEVPVAPAPPPPSAPPDEALPPPPARAHGITFEAAPRPAAALPVVSFALPIQEQDSVKPVANDRDGGTHFDLGFGTDAPLSVGGVATLEVPGRILFQLGLGFMPNGYVSAIDGFLTAVKAYDQSVSGLVRGALGNAFVLRASGGFRPFPGAGLEIMGGYTLITLGGSTTAADVIDAVLAESGAAQRVPAAALSAQIPVRATLHNAHVSLGWRWLLADDHLVIRASLSYIQTLASSVSVSLANVGGAAAASESAVNESLDGFVSPYFKKYAKAPLLGLSAAYRF